MKFPLCLLLCSLSTECGSVFVDLACTSLSASFASFWWNFHALFLFVSRSSVVGSRSATSYLATALPSARGRASICCCESSSGPSAPILALVLQIHNGSLCNLDREEVSRVLISPGISLLLNWRGTFCCFSHRNPTLLVQLSVSDCIQKMKFNLGGETGNRASKFAPSGSCCSL